MGALRQVATDAASTVVARLTGIRPTRRRSTAAVGHVMAARG